MRAVSKISLAKLASISVLQTILSLALTFSVKLVLELNIPGRLIPVTTLGMDILELKLALAVLEGKFSQILILSSGQHPC
jgi:hypothetical protein